jgi:hypothetical protein
MAGDKEKNGLPTVGWPADEVASLKWRPGAVDLVP